MRKCPTCGSKFIYQKYPAHYFCLFCGNEIKHMEVHTSTDEELRKFAEWKVIGIAVLVVVSIMFIIIGCMVEILMPLFPVGMAILGWIILLLLTSNKNY